MNSGQELDICSAIWASLTLNVLFWGTSLDMVENSDSVTTRFCGTLTINRLLLIMS